MDGDSSLGDLSKIKYHNRSIDIDHGRGEMMMGYPTGPATLYQNYQFLTHMKKWCIKYTPMSKF